MLGLMNGKRAVLNFQFRKYLLPTLLIIAGVAGVLGVTALTVHLYQFVISGDSQQRLTNPDIYQAVFLTNDQIYFGHLKDVESDYPVLEDVYYVQVSETSAGGQAAKSIGRLVKLGESEPHRPTNRMVINKDQILFWEDLNADSPVVQTILNLKLQGR